MSARIFIPADSTALAVGAEAVARAHRDAGARAALDVEIVRTGSRGLFWLEPLVEVETPEGRVGYGPVDAADVALAVRRRIPRRRRASQGARAGSRTSPI